MELLRPLRTLEFLRLGLYDREMHDFVIREIEVGNRVAKAEEDEFWRFLDSYIGERYAL